MNKLQQLKKAFEGSSIIMGGLGSIMNCAYAIIASIIILGFNLKVVWFIIAELFVLYGFLHVFFNFIKYKKKEENDKTPRT